MAERDIEQNLLVNSPVDLIIRTGGFSRLSNFMMWQASYAEIYVTKTLLEAIDEYQSFKDIFNTVQDDDEIHVLIEDELSGRLKGPYGFIFTNYVTPMNIQGQIGVLGPARLRYMSIIPTVRYFGNLIQVSAKGW